MERGKKSRVKITWGKVKGNRETETSSFSFARYVLHGASALFPGKLFLVRLRDEAPWTAQ